MSLYTDLIAAGVPIGNWQSDLYAPVNDTVKEILKRHPGQAKAVFQNQIDGSLWYEFPFQYDPFWSRIDFICESLQSEKRDPELVEQLEATSQTIRN